jgi:hypothetical protein
MLMKIAQFVLLKWTNNVLFSNVSISFMKAVCGSGPISSNSVLTVVDLSIEYLINKKYSLFYKRKY